MSYSYQNPVSSPEESVLATNKVLRSTYLMLSLTLLFTALTAMISIKMEMPPFAWYVHLIVAVGLYFLVYVTRTSILGIFSLFAFTGYFGLAIGWVIQSFLVRYTNGASLVAMAAGTTGIAFLSLSAIAIVTKKDFSFMGKFLLTGLIICILAMIANIFFAMPIMSLVISIVVALIMCGYILYDTSAIINGGETNYLMATVALYLDIINLFLALLRIFGVLGGDD